MTGEGAMGTWADGARPRSAPWSLGGRGALPEPDGWLSGEEERMNKNEAQGLRSFISEADAAISRQGKGSLALLAIYHTSEDWLSDCPEVNEFVVQVHRTTSQALSAMLANPTRDIPAPLRHVADPHLASMYSWALLRADTQPRVSNIMNYGQAELVARRLVGVVLERRHYARLESACEQYWAEFRAGIGQYREPWDALLLLVFIAFGDHAKVIERFDRDLHFDLAAHESACRDLAKLAYLLAKIGSGTADEAMRYGAKALLLVSQFNYLRWIASDQEDARIDLVAVVLATQLYQQIVGPKAESTEAFFRALSPEVVVAKMQAEVAPRTP